MYYSKVNGNYNPLPKKKRILVFSCKMSAPFHPKLAYFYKNLGYQSGIRGQSAYLKYSAPDSNSGMSFSPGMFLATPGFHRSVCPILPKMRPSGLKMPSMA